MLTGSKPALSPDASDGSAPLSPELQAFAAWLLSNHQVIECKAAVNAFLFEIECTANNPIDGVMEAEPQELDSGTWFLARVSGLPATDARGGIVSIVRNEANWNAESGLQSEQQIPAFHSPRGEMFARDASDELNAIRAELDKAHAVVAAAIQIVGGYSMMNHQGFYLVGRAEYERLQRALGPYRELPRDAAEHSANTQQ